MKLNLKLKWQREMLRPLIYKGATRFMAALIALLMYRKLSANGVQMSATAAACISFIFAISAWLIFLRMDGLRIPRVKNPFSKKRKDPFQGLQSPQDHMDDEPVSFEELEESERDLISFLASAANFAVYLILSFAL